MRRCPAALACVLFTATLARGAELNVISQANSAVALKQIAAQFERTSSVQVSLALGNPGVTLERLRKGEPADVVIVTTTILDAVIGEGHIQPATRVEIARGQIGLGVAAGAEKPAMTDRASFIALVRKLNTIGLVDPASGGGTSPPFIKAVEALGMAAEIAPKYRFYKGAGDAVADAIARHEVEAGVTATSELAPNRQVQLVGAIPPDVLDWKSTTSAAVGAHAKAPADAAKFIAFLQTPFARAAFRAIGLE